MPGQVETTASCRSWIHKNRRPIRHGIWSAAGFLAGTLLMISVRRWTGGACRDSELQTSAVSFSSNNDLQVRLGQKQDQIDALSARVAELEAERETSRSQAKELKAMQERAANCTKYLAYMKRKEAALDGHKVEREHQESASPALQEAFCKSDYYTVYRCSREFFDYESPLPVKKPPSAAKAKFANAPQLFDFHEAAQVRLWEEFIEAKYVKREHQDLLRNYGAMYPDLDRTFLFCFLQKIKPARMLEIGSGESTMIAKAAFEAIALEGHRVDHAVIEPYRAYEVPVGIAIRQQEMQEVDFFVFDRLEEGDVLFIDSSHVVMPYGDTLTELLTVLPRLNKGVFVHIHDIFLPGDYKPNWGIKHHELGIKNHVYTEQWLVSLMLWGAASEWEVIWAAVFMTNKHLKLLKRLPNYPRTPGQGKPEGSSLWLRKTGLPIRP